MNRIRTSKDINRLLDRLIDADSRLVPIAEVAGPLPLRLSKPDFAGLAEIVVSQHVSKLSAAAIMRRLVEAVNPLTASQLINTSDETLIEVGLTRAKRRTLQDLASSIVTGELNLEDLCELTEQEATKQLTSFKGVGPWTAEVFLLFCGGHVDVFPAGDVALQTAIGDAFNLESRPNAAEAKEFSIQWAPFRGVAARLLWAYYAAVRVGNSSTK